jgi:hypothetical protein
VLVILFFYINGNVRKEFFLAGPRVNSAYYVTFHGNCMKICKDSGNKIIHSCTTSHFFLTGEHDCHPPASLFLLFPRLKIKLKDRHFDTTEVIEAESQAALNALTEHDLQDAFETAEALGTAHTHSRGLLQGWAHT